MAGKNHFTVLDSWRGVCALGVALYHLSATSHFYKWNIIRNADIGVEFFFVLSGFVIAHAYGAQLATGQGGWSFLIRRFGRLYPLHLATLLFLFLLEIVKFAMTAGLHIQSGAPAFSGSTSWLAFAGNIFLINGLGFFDTYTWNGVSWSISTEAFAYLIFLMICVTALERSLIVCISAAVMSATAIVLVPLPNIQGGGLLACITGFFMGVVTYAAYKNVATQGKAPPGWTEWPVLALIGAVFYFHSEASGWRVAASLVFSGALIVFAFERGTVSRILRTSSLRYLGLVSYSIYMVHEPILAILNGVLRVLQSKFHVTLLLSEENGTQMIDFGNTWVMDAMTIAYLCIVVAVAATTYRYIEDPARRYFNALSRRVPVTTAPSLET